jgi:hypothetical protein
MLLPTITPMIGPANGATMKATISRMVEMIQAPMPQCRGVRAAPPALIQHKEGKDHEVHEDSQTGASREAHELPFFVNFVGLALPSLC